jgi:hypothetical protein
VADIKLFGDDVDDRVKGQDAPKPLDAVVAVERIAKAPMTDGRADGSRPLGREARADP